jgi:hypothetical protein
MILQHQPCEQVNKGVNVEYAQNCVDPFGDEVVFCQLPVRQEGDSLVVNELGLVAAVEEHLFRIETFHQVLKQFPHSFELEV